MCMLVCVLFRANIEDHCVWYLTSYSLVEIYRCVGGTCRLYVQGRGVKRADKSG
jgi:hypothetical protein